MTEALGDTSLFVALEQGRSLKGGAPSELLVSAVTVGELRSGVLEAPDVDTRAQRLETLAVALRYAPLAVDDVVSVSWARLRTQLREKGRRMPINDSWIAATALAHGLPVVTQDDDFDVVDGLEVIKL